MRRRRHNPLAGVLTGPLLRAAPPNWHRRPVPPPKVCYKSKSDALKAFIEANRDVVDNYGGETYKVSPAEFDAINRKYGARADTIAEAIWEALRPQPKGQKFCLTDIDLDALNDTSPAREAEASIGVVFRLPDHVYDQVEPTHEPIKPRAAPKNWQAQCRVWKKRTQRVRADIADDCFGVRKHEQCTCRDDRGRFVPCHYDPEVPF